MNMKRIQTRLPLPNSLMRMCRSCPHIRPPTPAIQSIPPCHLTSFPRRIFFTHRSSFPSLIHGPHSPHLPFFVCLCPKSKSAYRTFVHTSIHPPAQLDTRFSPTSPLLAPSPPPPPITKAPHHITRSSRNIPDSSPSGPQTPSRTYPCARSGSPPVCTCRMPSPIASWTRG